MNLKLDTFGKSKACANLAQIINESQVSIFEKRKILAFINRANTIFKQISYIKDPKVKKHILRLVRDDLLNTAKISKHIGLNNKIHTHINNVVIYYYRRGNGAPTK